MWQDSQIVREGRATLRLAVPLIAGQLSQMLIVVVDTWMIGRLGVVPLAASTFANTLLHLPFMFGIGMCVAVSITTSQARGANKPEQARESVRNGLYIGLGIGVLTALGSLIILPFLPVFQQTTEVVQAVPGYFVLVGFSMIFAIGAMVIKNHADGLNRPWPPFWIILGSVILNGLLNWVFIYGNLGAPALGLEGAGVATLISRIAMLGGLLLWCLNAPGQLREWMPARWLRKPQINAIRGLLRLGLPTSAQLVAEIGAFVVATLIVGSLGNLALASHQIAITCAATVFMVPLGLSMALTVQVGEAWGSGAFERIRPIVKSGWLMVALFSALSASIFGLFNTQLAGIFTTDPEAIRLTAILITVAAFFQFSDSFQIVCSGILRGLSDVNVTALIAILCYWLVSLPLGWYLAIPCKLGVESIWWAITLGLTLTAVLLTARAWIKSGPKALLHPVINNDDGPATL